MVIVMRYLSFLWRKRRWILATVKKDIRKDYRNSLLGLVWLFLPSIVKVTIYYIVFSTILSGRIPGVDGNGFVLYLIIGILSWDVFSSTISSGARMYIENRDLILAGVFQKSLVPIFNLFESWFGATVVFSLLVVIAVYLQASSVIGIFQIFLLFLIQQILAISIALILSIYRVFFDDIDHLVAMTIQTWFWVTPIVYPVNILPDWLEGLVKTFNPFYPFVDLYHQAFVLSGSVPWISILKLLGFSLTFAVVAILIYFINRKKLENML